MKGIVVTFILEASMRQQSSRIFEFKKLLFVRASRINTVITIIKCNMRQHLLYAPLYFTAAAASE